MCIVTHLHTVIFQGNTEYRFLLLNEHLHTPLVSYLFDPASQVRLSCPDCNPTMPDCRPTYFYADNLCFLFVLADFFVVSS